MQEPRHLPSEVNTGYTLTDSGVIKYIGCTNHRLENITDLIFNTGAGRASSVPQGDRVARESGHDHSLSLFGRPMRLDTVTFYPGSVHVRSKARV